jgi:hypothetical protein
MALKNSPVSGVYSFTLVLPMVPLPYRDREAATANVTPGKSGNTDSFSDSELRLHLAMQALARKLSKLRTWVRSSPPLPSVAGKTFRIAVKINISAELWFSFGAGEHEVLPEKFVPIPKLPVIRLFRRAA